MARRDVVAQNVFQADAGQVIRRRGLIDAYLPILQTSYTDAAGVHYRQESFVGRANGVYGTRSAISFMQPSIVIAPRLYCVILSGNAR